MIIKSLNSKNTSEAVLFLLTGSKKRRSMAKANARMVQRELGLIPNLVAVK